MYFQWMDEIPWLKKIKNRVNIRHRLGDIFSFLPKTGAVAKPDRPHGISVMMRLRNESRFIEAAMRSLAPFVEHFSIIDNGSTDGTPDIIRRVAEELSLDVTLEILPTENFLEVCDSALHNTKYRWVLRWDGDMIARTQGDKTLARLREYLDSLDPDVFYAVYFPHVRLEGDLRHQDPDYKLHYEEWLFTYSPKLYHSPTGRFRETIYPLYYKRVYVWDTWSFHIASLDDPVATVVRKYWEPWRMHDDGKTYPSLKDYAAAHILDDYGTESLEEAGALHCRERFRRLVPYDEEKYGEYPELMRPFFDSINEKIVYRDGSIAGRNDIMDTLDRIDAEKNKTLVDVIMSTRGRRDIPVETVKLVLKDNYPNFRVIVIDQNDDPLSEIAELASVEEKLIYLATDTRGLPAGRNEGLRLSNAEIVIFIDDDVIPSPGFIEGHVRAYIPGNVGGAGGKVIEQRPEADKPAAPGRIGRVNYFSGDINRGFTSDKWCDIDAAQGANMSFKREELLAIGGFESSYGGSFLFEEADVFFRLKARGCRIRYTPEAELIHVGAPSGGCRVDDITRAVYWYSHNYTLLFLRHFPCYTFPTFFTIRFGKIVRDSIRHFSFKPFFAGIRGFLNGYMSWRRLVRKTGQAV